MNLKKSILFVTAIFTIAMLQSCGEYKKTDNGLEYKIIVDSAGPEIQLGGVAFVHMFYTNEKDTFDSQKMNNGMPLPIRLPDSLNYKASFEEGLSLLSIGDSASFKVSTDSLYKYIFHQPLPTEIKAGGLTTFNVKMVNVISKDSVLTIESKRKEEKMAAEIQSQLLLQKDTVAILDYCKINKIAVKRTLDGVYYVIKKAAQGITLMPGDTAKTFYTGKTLAGAQFDSNVGKEPFPVVVGYDQVIRGWHSGLMAMKKGEKATLFIPSSLGYGAQGAGGVIPPNSILIFDIEVLK